MTSWIASALVPDAPPVTQRRDDTPLRSSTPCTRRVAGRPSQAGDASRRSRGAVSLLDGRRPRVGTASRKCAIRCSSPRSRGGTTPATPPPQPPTGWSTTRDAGDPPVSRRSIPTSTSTTSRAGREVELVDGDRPRRHLARERLLTSRNGASVTSIVAARDRAERSLAVVLRRGHHGRERDGLHDRRHTRRAARRRAPHAPGAGHRHGHRSRDDRHGSSSVPSRYEGPTGIVGVLTTRAAPPASARCRCGRRSRTTSPRRRTRPATRALLERFCHARRRGVRPRRPRPARRHCGGVRSTTPSPTTTR